MPPSPTLRFADRRTAEAYPLPVEGPGAWQPRDGSCRLVIPLPELGAGSLLLPSLSLSPHAWRDDQRAEPSIAPHQWTLTAGDTSWSLQTVPAAPAPASRRQSGPVSTHIDCFHVHQRLARAELHVDVAGHSTPERYLASVSARALTVVDPPAPSGAAALGQPPPPRSQMTAPGAIASRICSPTCVSMVLGLWDRNHDWLGVVQECHDPGSGLYGVWPLALAAAARRGCLGAVEAFDSWEAPLAVLERGVPLVTSIRFSAGELAGAPLDETGGHLVVVYGASPHEVAVCDPAAADGEVVRRYSAAEFSRAWLSHRGAAYILPP